jgi:hypothetical protein
MTTRNILFDYIISDILLFLPVIDQVKKKITGISFALRGGQLFSSNPRSGVGFSREKIL